MPRVPAVAGPPVIPLLAIAAVPLAALIALLVYAWRTNKLLARLRVSTNRHRLIIQTHEADPPELFNPDWDGALAKLLEEEAA